MGMVCHDEAIAEAGRHGGVSGRRYVLEKPLNRLISQGGNVDWFDFWLNRHEDDDPAKAEQYDRWRKLRAQIEASRAQADDLRPFLSDLFEAVGENRPPEWSGVAGRFR